MRGGELIRAKAVYFSSQQTLGYLEICICRINKIIFLDFPVKIIGDYALQNALCWKQGEHVSGAF